ncbi:cell division cycle- protein, partial [Tilletia horrida]
FIYYNTQTGAESYDLPERPEASDVLSSEEYTTASSRGHGNAPTSSVAAAAAAAAAAAYNTSKANENNNRFAPTGGVPAGPNAANLPTAANFQRQLSEEGRDFPIAFDKSTIASFPASAFGIPNDDGIGEDSSVWKPRLTDNGQIYVVNLETGETRWPQTGLGTESAKGGAITLANIAEAFEMAAHPVTGDLQQPPLAGGSGVAAGLPTAPASSTASSVAAAGPTHAPRSGSTGSSAQSSLSRLAGLGTNGIRGLRSVLGVSSAGSAAGGSATAAAASAPVPAAALASSSSASAGGTGSQLTITAISGGAGSSSGQNADVDEGSMEGYLRDRYERARHTASATGVRSSRAALLEGAAGAKAEDGAPASMVADEASALALQRRMEPALAENMEALREHALETIDQLAIAVLPQQYASHQRVQAQGGLAHAAAAAAAGSSDAHIQLLLAHLIHAVRELLLASGTLEASSADLAALAELSGISGAGCVPARIAVPPVSGSAADKNTAAAAVVGPGMSASRQGQDGSGANGLVNGVAALSSDLPSSLSEAMATLHNTNKGFAAAPISRHVRDIVALTASQAAMGTAPQELRDIAKKACSTLSKVVFSARAISEELSHVQSSLRSSSGAAGAGAGAAGGGLTPVLGSAPASSSGGRSGSVSAGSGPGAMSSSSDSAQVRAEREQSMRQRVREQAIELAQTIAFLTDECEKARLGGGGGGMGANTANGGGAGGSSTTTTESWVRRAYPVLRSGIGTAGIGLDTLSGGMAAGWRGSGFSLPSALDTAALRAEAMGNYNNPFDLTKDAQIALASGKLAMRRRPAHPLSTALWKERVEPYVVALRVLLVNFNGSIAVDDDQEQEDKGKDEGKEAGAAEQETDKKDDEVDSGDDEIDEDDDRLTMTGQSDEGERTAENQSSLNGSGRPAQPPTLTLEDLFRRAREIMLRLGTVQTLIEDVDFASSLDVDSCSDAIQADAAAKELARRAREGLNHFLWHKQDLQDLGCTLMMDLQDGVPTRTLLQTTGGILASVDALVETLDELVRLADLQVASTSTLIGSRARVYGARDIAPPPTASQVMTAAAAANGAPGAMRAAEAVAVGMGLTSGIGLGGGAGGVGGSSGGGGAGAASLLDENHINDGSGPGVGGDASGAGGAEGESTEQLEEEDAGVMYLGPGIAVPDGPPGQGRNRADSSARGASPALSGTTMVTGRTRAGSVTNRSVVTTTSDRPGSVSTAVGGGASGGGGGSGPGSGPSSAVGVSGDGSGVGGGGEDDGEHRGGKGKEASIPPIVEESPWFLEPDYAPGDIVMTPEGQVKGATLSALMERLTTHQQFDSVFNTTFLLTYRSFTTTREFLDRVLARYRISPPVGLTPSEHEVWVSKKQRPIQMRVFNVLKLWLEQHFYEGEDEAFLPDLKEFARGEAATAAKSSDAQLIYAASTALLRILDRRDGAGEQSVRTPMHATSAPASLFKNTKKIKLLNIEPLEMARQLTLVESHRYRQIKPAECLGKAWTAPNAEVNAKGIKTMIALSNDLTGWVMESILAQTDLKTRSSYIKQFILIADRCRGLNNFSTMTAIISALNSAPIHRMKRTWDAVNQRTVALLDSLMRTMSSTKNFAYYRDLLHKLNPPCVPFLGVWLTDLTFIEDGNPDRLKTDNRLINFNKRQKTAEIIREIMIYQSTLYNLTPVPQIQDYLEQVLVPSKTQDLMFDQSEKLEPKEREDERIARLLQE